MTDRPNSTTDAIRFVYRGRTVVVWKRPVHQWRTDIMLNVDGREAYLGRLEGVETRGDVKRMARAWLDRQDEGRSSSFEARNSA